MKNKILKSILTLGMLLTIVTANCSFPSLPISPEMTDNGIQVQCFDDDIADIYR